ncbi:hypothetical protein ABBQ38_15564 [Trebouxia sp. C0009 RCD-2024]
MAQHRPEDQLEAVEAELSQVEADIENLLAKQQRLQSQLEQLHQTITLNSRAPRADWQGHFAWSNEINHLLRTAFNLQSFRPVQREVINAIMQGRDVLCLLPSGGGKSLCYQLPALTGKGVTLVVSPLLSLIQDQVLGLRARGIKALALTSITPKEQITSMYHQMESDEDIRMVYATPERIVGAKRFMGKLEKLYKAGRLDRIAIDEAHCCSQWGNDFRPDYKKLGVLKQQFPDVPILALTATATQRVCNDLKTMLRMEACESFSASINRPNLLYEVRAKPKAAAEQIEYIVDWMAATYPNGESGIVYCLTRKDTEQVAAELAQHGIACGCYHADMDPVRRESVHMQWSSGQLQLIVATIAFGMGINKPDVRFVIHHSLSKSLENYYQESGRAGRDGLPAHCMLLYRFSDALRQAAIVNYEPSWQGNLFAMMRYASTLSTCRRSILCRYFAEAPAACHSMCDNCLRQLKVTRQDVSAAAAAVVQTLQALPAADKRLTLTQLVDAWRKSQVSGASELGKRMSKEDSENLLAHLVYTGTLNIDFGHTAYATNVYLKCAQRAGQSLDGKVVVLESLPDSSCAPDLVPHTQPASSSRAAQAGGRVAGRTAAHVEPKQSAGQKRPSAAEITEVLEISDDDDNEFLPDPKVSRRN